MIDKQNSTVRTNELIPFRDKKRSTCMILTHAALPVEGAYVCP